MPVAHRVADLRACGALTQVTGQSSVFVNGLLWAVEGDKNSHGEGPLLAVNGTTVTIEGKRVITIGDPGRAPDNLLHTPIEVTAVTGSDNVTAY